MEELKLAEKLSFLQIDGIIWEGFGQILQAFIILNIIFLIQHQICKMQMNKCGRCLKEFMKMMDFTHLQILVMEKHLKL